MKKSNFLLCIIIGLLQCMKTVYSRVVYVMAHAEKPGEGSMDGGHETFSTMDGLGYLTDGLGYTGSLIAQCMMRNFGPEAPYHRRPKRIITQQFVLQNNGDFIHSGIRGHHTSRRMYHQTYALALALGIDPDEEKCCGGNFYDLMDYINTLPAEDDPILIVNQHGVADSFIRGYAISNGNTKDFPFFDKVSNKVMTMIDGKDEEVWYMCCDGLVNNYKCSTGTPAWVQSYKFPTNEQKPPIVREVSYPSYIYTPENVAEGRWSISRQLRKRGLFAGDECVNEDLEKSEYLRNFTKRAIVGTESKNNNNNTNENENETNGYINLFNDLQKIKIFLLVFTLLFIFI